VDEDELIKIRDAVNLWNSDRKNITYYVLITDCNLGEELPKIFKNAEDFYQKQKAFKEKQEKQAAIDKAKRDAKAEERKRKQLEKLKRELGEQ
jgi:hypothetical protein